MKYITIKLKHILSSKNMSLMTDMVYIDHDMSGKNGFNISKEDLKKINKQYEKVIKNSINPNYLLTGDIDKIPSIIDKNHLPLYGPLKNKASFILSYYHLLKKESYSVPSYKMNQYVSLSNELKNNLK